jgi:hypothetical protein
MLGAPMLAAQALVVPPNAAARDATGPLEPFPGTYLDSRQQIVIGATRLTSLQPMVSRIEALSFRRDGSQGSALTAGRARLTVRASSLARAPGDAGEWFAFNHGATVETCFDGEIDFPASPRLTTRDEPTWTAPYSFTIPLTPPIVYRGGALCIEIDGRALQPTRWPVDVHSDLVQGTIARVGTACGPITAVTTRTANTSVWYLRPGATAVIDVLEVHGTVGVLALGSQLSPPLNLAFLGAPGCALHVHPAVTFPTLILRRPGRGPTHPGAGRVTLPLPNLANLAGAQVPTQWVHLHGSRLTTSDALLLGLGGSATTDVAVVSSARADALALPPSGRVRTGSVPVVALQVR